MARLHRSLPFWHFKSRRDLEVFKLQKASLRSPLGGNCWSPDFFSLFQLALLHWGGQMSLQKKIPWGVCYCPVASGPWVLDKFDITKSRFKKKQRGPEFSLDGSCPDCVHEIMKQSAPRVKLSQFWSLHEMGKPGPTEVLGWMDGQPRCRWMVHRRSWRWTWGGNKFSTFPSRVGKNCIIFLWGGVVRFYVAQHQEESSKCWIVAYHC